MNNYNFKRRRTYKEIGPDHKRRRQLAQQFPCTQADLIAAYNQALANNHPVTRCPPPKGHAATFRYGHGLPDATLHGAFRDGPGTGGRLKSTGGHVQAAKSADHQASTWLKQLPRASEHRANDRKRSVDRVIREATRLFDNPANRDLTLVQQDINGRW
jgi:hypothetical protein